MNPVAWLRPSTKASSQISLADDRERHLVLRDRTMSSSTYLRIKLLHTTFTLEMILLTSDCMYPGGASCWSCLPLLEVLVWPWTDSVWADEEAPPAEVVLSASPAPSAAGNFRTHSAKTHFLNFGSIFQPQVAL